LAGSGCPARTAAPRRTASDRQRLVKTEDGGLRDLLHRHGECKPFRQRREADGIVEDDERPRVGAPGQPSLEAEFAADAGRLAHGDGERQRPGHGFLISMVATRRRSRM
jgi:hypothetical protein